MKHDKTKGGSTTEQCDKEIHIDNGSSGSVAQGQQHKPVKAGPEGNR